MTVQRDFKELLECLNERRVEYVIVGAHALAAHGLVRATGDMDVYLRPTPANAERVLAALADFGFASLDLEVSDLVAPERVIQLGVKPLRVDLITSLSAVTWEEADAGKIEGTYGDVTTWYLGREEFIRNKRAAGRPRDLGDLDSLGEL